MSGIQFTTIYSNKKTNFGITPVISKGGDNYVVAQINGPILLDEIHVGSETTDLLIIHFDQDGKTISVIPVLSYFGQRDLPNIASLSFDKDDHFYLATSFEGKVILTNGQSFQSSTTTTLLIRLDNNGNIVFVVQINGLASDLLRIVTDDSGNTYVISTFVSTMTVLSSNADEIVEVDTNEATFVLFKFDSSGIQQWMLTGSGSSSGNDIALMPNHNLAIIGNFDKRLEIGTLILEDSASLSSTFVAIIDSTNGNILDTKLFREITHVEMSYVTGSGITVDSNNIIYITGEVFGIFQIGELVIDVTDPHVYIIGLDCMLSKVVTTNLITIQLNQGLKTFPSISVSPDKKIYGTFFNQDRAILLSNNKTDDNIIVIGQNTGVDLIVYCLVPGESFNWIFPIPNVVETRSKLLTVCQSLYVTGGQVINDDVTVFFLIGFNI